MERENEDTPLEFFEKALSNITPENIRKTIKLQSDWLLANETGVVSPISIEQLILDTEVLTHFSKIRSTNPQYQVGYQEKLVLYKKIDSSFILTDEEMFIDVHKDDRYVMRIEAEGNIHLIIRAMDPLQTHFMRIDTVSYKKAERTIKIKVMIKLNFPSNSEPRYIKREFNIFGNFKDSKVIFSKDFCEVMITP